MTDTRYTRFLCLTLCSILGSGCASSARGVAGALPAGYKALDLPQRTIPIGARWLSTGPDGPGAPEDELTRVESAARLTDDRTFAQRLEVAVTRYLGIEGAAARSVRVDVSGLTIVRLASLERSNLSAGATVLYEGLKAAKITVSYDAAFDASIKASVQYKEIPFAVVSETTARRSLTLDGEDLFLAYRVVTLEGRKGRRWREELTTDATIKGYELRLDVRDVEACMCDAWRKGGDWSAIERCATEVPGLLHVVNLDRAKPDGSYFERTFEVFGQAVNHPSAITLKQGPSARFALGTTYSGDHVTNETLMVRSRFSPLNVNGCMVLPQSHVELARARFRLRSVKPSGVPGW